MPTVPAVTLSQALQFTNGNITSIYFSGSALDVRMQQWITDFFGIIAPSGSFPLPDSYSFLPKTNLVLPLLANSAAAQDQFGIARCAEVVAEVLASVVREINFDPDAGGLLAVYNATWT
jgi:hypothetical protein